MIYKERDRTATRRPLTVTGAEGMDGWKCNVTAGCDESQCGHINEGNAENMASGGETHQAEDESYKHGEQEGDKDRRMDQWREYIVLVQQKERCRGIPRKQRKYDCKPGMRRTVRGRNKHYIQRILRRRREQYGEVERWSEQINVSMKTGNTIRRISDIRSWKGGRGYTQEEQEESLFAQYLARLSQLPDKAQPGAEEYKPMQRSDFERLSVKRRLMELKKIGMEVDSIATAKMFFVRKDEGNYPSTHTLTTANKWCSRHHTHFINLR